MKIILLQDIPKVGKKWEVKNVADGFAQNSLIPRGLAESATEKAAARALAARAASDALRNASAEALAKNLGALEGARIEITAKANAQGHLFGAIHGDAVLAALKEKTGVAVHSELLKTFHPIKTTGEHPLEIAAGAAKAKFMLVVSPPSSAV